MGMVRRRRRRRGAMRVVVVVAPQPLSCSTILLRDPPLDLAGGPSSGRLLVRR
jgi:hypothetical protein